MSDKSTDQCYQECLRRVELGLATVKDAEAIRQHIMELEMTVNRLYDLLCEAHDVLAREIGPHNQLTHVLSDVLGEFPKNH